MRKDRAIPPGYMTVGEVAKKMGVSVRTLQYYDKMGLHSPSAESEGGRRLYTNKDLVRLHQILSLKSLGFSLEDIRERLFSLDTPDDVAKALTEQSKIIADRIEGLSESLTAIERLKEEVLQMQSVDFAKYADIIVNLQMKNEMYYLIKRFDEETLAHIRNNFDQESGPVFMEKFKDICAEILELSESNAAPEDESWQQLAQRYWELIMEFTRGDLSMLSKLMKVNDFLGERTQQEQQIQKANVCLEPALEIYFAKQGVNPFPEN